MIIGVDIGTSGIKALSFDEDRAVILRKCSRPHRTYFPYPGHAEQDPDEIISNLIRCVDNLMGGFEGHVVVSLSTVLHSVVALDSKGNRLTNLLIWADRRAREEKKLLEKEFGRNFFYFKTGCPLHSMYLPPKILWVKKKFKNARIFLSLKSYIIYRLSGKAMEDMSVASASGLFNFKDKSWDKEILSMLDINASNLPEIVSPYMSLDVKNVFKRDVLLVVGSGDGMLANLGVGAFKGSLGVITLGSSGAVRIFTERPILDQINQSTWCYMLDGETYVLGAAINNGGIVLSWLRDLMKMKDYSEEFNRASKISPGANDLIFLPFINGERSPGWIEDYKGVLIGLTSSHRTVHILRSAMEGIAFRMKMVLESIERVSGKKLHKMLSTGGFTKSDVFMQLIADVVSRKLMRTNVEESVAFGAILIGAKVTGLDWKDILEKVVRLEKTVTPDGERSRAYQKVYEKFLYFYEMFKDVWKEGN